eukprot:4569984-Pleurochrysis_carterae.AAC.1
MATASRLRLTLRVKLRERRKEQCLSERQAMEKAVYKACRGLCAEITPRPPTAMGNRARRLAAILSLAGAAGQAR